MRRTDPRPAARSVWVCLPTYDEVENVAAMTGRLLDVFDRCGIDGRVLIIDDGSPDGTGDVADDLAAAHDRVEVLHRAAKEGIGPAYRAGFRRALEAGADLVMEMDCDFSHDPEAVPALVAAADDADLVIGSRYTDGGAVRDWGRARRLISRGGCRYAQAVLGLGVRDLTGGFKCFRRAVLEALPLDEVSARGYGFQIELTYRAALAGFAVREVPIVFRDRELGRSKMSRRIVMEAAVLVPRLRRRLGAAVPAPVAPVPALAGEGERA